MLIAKIYILIKISTILYKIYKINLYDAFIYKS